MEKIENKAEYFFGDKPVIDKAADEDEFEGAVTEQVIFNPEETIEKILTLNLADFWNQIWVELATLGCTVEVSEDYKHVILKNVSAMARAKYPLRESPYVSFDEDTASAKKKGWIWNDNVHVVVKQIWFPSTFAEAVISWMFAECGAKSGLSMIRKDMQVEPNEVSAYNDWLAFFNDAFNFCEHNLTNFKGKPVRDLVLKNDGNKKVTIAQDAGAFYFVEYFTS